MIHNVDPKCCIEQFYQKRPLLPIFIFEAAEDRSVISEAMADWMRYTCLRIRSYQYGDQQWINIQDDGGYTVTIALVQVQTLSYLCTSIRQCSEEF